MSSALALPAGTQVGGLLIQRVLGRGGFGIVYEARDPDLDRDVALKEFFMSNYARREGTAVLPVDASAGEILEQGKARFLREARLLAMLHERARVQTGSLLIVHRVLQANQTAYMVMKLYQGPTFGALVRQDPSVVTQSWLTPLLLRVLDALDALHSLPNENLVHRDVSPDNIIVQPDGTPVLLDFGATRSSADKMTAVIVKEGYSPIEQYTDLHPQGPWTDLYALCGTAYYAICGRAPGYAVNRLAGGTFVSAAQRGAGRFSEGFLQVLDRGLAVLPGDRYQSVAEMRQALEVSDSSSAVNSGHSSAAAIDPDATRIQPVLQPSSLGGAPGSNSGFRASAATPKTSPAQPGADVPIRGGHARRSSPKVVGALALLLAMGGLGAWILISPLPPVVTAPSAAPVLQPPEPLPSVAQQPATGAVSALLCSMDRASWPCVVEGLVQSAPSLQGQKFEITPSSATVGERLNLRFVSPMAGYLYVFAVDEPTDSVVTLLFPRADDLDHRVKANVPLALPRRPIWDIVVNPPLGRSWLLAVSTAQPVPAWQPASFKPVTLMKAMAAFQSKAPWQAFGIEACAPGTACTAPQTVVSAELVVR